MSEMSAGVMPVHVAVTGLAGSPRSKTMSPLAPAGARWMCMMVAPTTSCTQVMSAWNVGWLNTTKQPPLAAEGTGGTSWSPRSGKTKVWASPGPAVASSARTAHERARRSRIDGGPPDRRVEAAGRAPTVAHGGRLVRRTHGRVRADGLLDACSDRRAVRPRPADRGGRALPARAGLPRPRLERGAAGDGGGPRAGQGGGSVG